MVFYVTAVSRFAAARVAGIQGRSTQSRGVAACAGATRS